MTQVLNPPLIHVITPLKPGLVRTGVQIALGVFVLALLAQFEVTIGPVPITGQTLGVLLVGATYGLTLGGVTLLAYLMVGALGVGVFAGGGAGLATLTGATAGYLAGFVLAAMVVGYLAQRGFDRTFWGTVIAMVIGNVIIYALGLAWLNRIAPDWNTTLQWGLWPFLIGDLIKLLIAATLLPLAWRIFGQSKTPPSA